MDAPIAIPSRPLGKTGLSVSTLGFGAEAIGRTGRTFEDADRTLNAVLDLGVTLIDTASAYGSSEEFIGRAIMHRKNDFTLVTKCGWARDWTPAWSPDQLVATIDLSLRNLKTDCLDVLLIHSCPLDDLKKGDAINAVKHAKAQGKARFIGYSGDNDALHFAIGTGIFDVIETSFNILDQANAPAIAEARSRNTGVLIKRPIANAVPGRTEKPKSEYASQYWPRWQAFQQFWHESGYDPEHPNWLELAARFSANWSGVSSILIGSSHAEHMKDNAQLLSLGKLPGDALSQLIWTFEMLGKDWPGLG